MRQILDRISRHELTRNLLDAVKNGDRGVHAMGLAGSLKSILAAVLYQQTGRTLLLVAEDPDEIDALHADLVSLLSPDHLLLFREEKHTAATTRETLDAEVIALTDGLKILGGNPIRIVLTDATTLAEGVPPPEAINASVTTLRRGKALPFDEFAKDLMMPSARRNPLQWSEHPRYFQCASCCY